MASVKGCFLPDDRLYHVPEMVWYQPLPGGAYRLGGTMVAVGMAGNIVEATPKRAQLRLEAGQACAVIESGKLVSAAKVAFAGVVEDSNEDLMENPGWLNEDIYGRGWFIVLRPDDPVAARALLLSADEAVEPFLAVMAAEEFDGCGG